MGQRSADDGTQDTSPGRRVGRGGSNESRPAGTGLTSIPIYIWLLGLVVVLLVMAVAGLWALYLMRGQWTTSGPTPTPIVWTPTPMAAPPASPTPTVAPTEALPTASPDIVVGGYVRVMGTGGSGLNLRQGPGSNYPRMDVALEDEIFLVVAGPTEAGGVQWWKIRDPQNEQRAWWAAGNFLDPVPPP